MLSKIEEIKLIAKCVLGDDRQAFGLLVEAYQNSIRRFLLNLTMGDESLSDDLAQETFIKAYTNIRSFKGMAKFSTWLYRIAYNEFYSYSRKKKEERLGEGDDADGYTTNSNELGEYEASSNARMDVKVAMRVLSDIERTVITLYYLEDQPLKKICEITGINEGTVKSHLSRARGKMAKVLQK